MSLQVLLDAKITEIPTLAIGDNASGPYIRNTLAADKNISRVEALMDIYRVMRPGEPPTPETAEAMFSSLFLIRSAILVICRTCKNECSPEPRDG